MPTRRELYPSHFLSAADVEPPITATIDHCTVEPIRQRQSTRTESKPVAYFSNSAIKPLIVNLTNYDTIVQICGDENTDNWGGVVVELYAVAVTGPNGPTRGVRVRRPRKAAKPAAQAPRPMAVTDEIDDALPSTVDGY
jgi:hypothetical protein